MANNFDAMDSGAKKSGSTKTADQTSESCDQGGMGNDWVELEVVDSEKKPVPEVAYRLTAPDGQERRGVLDADGKARVEPINSGKCKVSFDEADSTLDYVTIQLADESGKGVLAQPYKLTLPDGQQIAGVLDRDGQATVRNFDSGSCQVEFEDVQPGEDWIEIELVDGEERPVPNERYAAELPDKRIVHGFLDKDGKAKIANIPTGQCRVKFLGPSTHPQDLVVQLVDCEEQPIPGEDYELTLPNGDKHSGKLDSSGIVTVRNTMAGIVKIEFRPVSDASTQRSDD